MLRRYLSLLAASWPTVLIAVPFAGVYCALVCFFADAIEAYGALRSLSSRVGWGGPEVLFAMNSAILGWVSIAFVGRRFGTGGLGVFMIALPWCLCTIAAGCCVGIVLLGRVPSPICEMGAYSVASVVGVSAARAWLQDVL